MLCYIILYYTMIRYNIRSYNHMCSEYISNTSGLFSATPCCRCVIVRCVPTKQDSELSKQTRQMCLYVHQEGEGP